MKKLLLALAVGAAMVVPQLPASAICVHLDTWTMHPEHCVDYVVDPVEDRNHTGGCSFYAAPDPVAGGGQMIGEIDVEAVVYSATNPALNPVTATFRCYIQVNHEPQPVAEVYATGTVVVAGGEVITYTSNSLSDFVQLCQDVNYANSAIPDTSECFESSYPETPPIFSEIVDGAVCPVLAALAGTYGGPPPVPVIFINSQGDVWVDGEGQYDCPPYGNVFGFPPNEG